MERLRLNEQSEDSAVKGQREIPAHWSTVCSGLTRTCCHNTLYAQSIEVKDKEGHSYFASVWHCPTCGRLTT